MPVLDTLLLLNLDRVRYGSAFGQERTRCASALVSGSARRADQLELLRAVALAIAIVATARDVRHRPEASTGRVQHGAIELQLKRPVAPARS